MAVNPNLEGTEPSKQNRNQKPRGGNRKREYCTTTRFYAHNGLEFPIIPSIVNKRRSSCTLE